MRQNSIEVPIYTYDNGDSPKDGGHRNRFFNKKSPKIHQSPVASPKLDRAPLLNFMDSDMFSLFTGARNIFESPGGFNFRSRKSNVVFGDYANKLERYFQLPRTVYSVGILVPMLEFKPGCDCTRLAQVAQSVALLVVNLALQIGFLWFLATVVHGGMEEGLKRCTDTPTVLQMVSVLAFCFLCTGDFAQTLHMMRWLYHLPKEQTIVLPSLAGDKSDEIVLRVERSKFTVAWSLVIIATKLLVCLALTGYGASMLLEQEDTEELLLNALALGFVFQISELIYQSLAPSYVKAVVLNAPIHKWLEYKCVNRCAVFPWLFAAGSLGSCLFVAFCDIPSKMAAK